MNLLIAIAPDGSAIACERHDDGRVTFWTYGGRLLGYVGQTGTPSKAVTIRNPKNKREREVVALAAKGIGRSGYLAKEVTP